MQHQTIYVETVNVIDPDAGFDVEVEFRKDAVTGSMVGLDGSYLAQMASIDQIHDHYNDGEVRA